MAPHRRTEGGRASPSASVIIYCGRPATTKRDDLDLHQEMVARGRSTRCQGGAPRTHRALPKVKVLGKQLSNFFLLHAVDRSKRIGAPHSTLPPRCGIIGSWTDAPWNGSATTS